jgi:hypothetical protein
MKNKKNEKEDPKLKPIAVVYGPPPRPSPEEKIDVSSSLVKDPNPPSIVSPSPDVSSFNPIPAPLTPKKKPTKSKDPVENPEDRVDVYGPPPPSLFGDD